MTWGKDNFWTRFFSSNHRGELPLLRVTDIHTGETRYHSINFAAWKLGMSAHHLAQIVSDAGRCVNRHFVVEEVRERMV